MEERNEFGFGEGEIIRVDENQIHWDGKHWVVEKYEYTDSNGIDMFSVVDGYKLLADAIDSAIYNMP